VRSEPTPETQIQMAGQTQTAEERCALHLLTKRCH